MKPTARTRWGIAAATVLAMSSVFAQPVGAAQPTPAGGNLWHANQSVGFRWRSDAVPPRWAQAAMLAAASDSNASRASRAAVFNEDDGASSWLAYTVDLPGDWAIGYTVSNAPHSFNIRIRPQGTVLDWGTLRWCEFYTSPPKGCYDMEMVTLHEFGHAQSLAHADESKVDDFVDTVMHATVHAKAKVGWQMHAFGRCDIARLQIRYLPLTTRTLYSTCLDLPTMLTLDGLTAGTVPGGVRVAFTAQLSVATAAPYSNLAGERASGRRVVLQRRLPGEAWAAVATMTPYGDDSGRYWATLTVDDAYDWRAVFADPTGEGLAGSASAVLRIYVSTTCAETAGATKARPHMPAC